MDQEKINEALISLARKHLLPNNPQPTRFPANLWIENTNCCNATCVMCPREQQTRVLGFMDLGLYEKMINEASQFKDTIERVHFHNYGEPLLDRHLPKRIRMAKDLGLRKTYFVTNASLLSEQTAAEIIDSGLDEFKISFLGTDPDSYNETMRGLDFQETLKNVRSFFRIRKKMKRMNPKVILQYLPQETNGSQVNKFKELFEPLLDKEVGDSINIFSLHNFGGGRQYNHLGHDILTVCHFPWSTLVVLFDGRVVTCCNDFNGLQVLGNAAKQSLEEIWNGKMFSAIREDFKKLDYQKYPVCKNCDWLGRL